MYTNILYIHIILSYEYIRIYLLQQMLTIHIIVYKKNNIKNNSSDIL